LYTKMPTKKPLLVCYLPNGAPVLNYAPDEFPLARLGAYLAQPDDPNETAPAPPDLETPKDDDGDEAKENKS
jgi:hypothetical protein